MVRDVAGEIGATPAQVAIAWTLLHPAVVSPVLGARDDEARGGRISADRGRYELDGAVVRSWDDTGFEADGVFVSDDELRHGGMILFRQKF